MKNDDKVKVTISWRPIVGEPSAAYRRLIHLLLKKRGEPEGTHEATDDGKINKRNKSRNSEK